MKSTESTEKTEIRKVPENYRKAKYIEDFSVGDIVYTLSRIGFAKGKVEAVTTHIYIKWDNCIYSTNYSVHQLECLYVEDKPNKPNKPEFKVGDRVRSTDAYSLDLIGTIVNISQGHIEVNWCSNKGKLSKGIYSKLYWYLLELIEEPKELTIDLKLHFNLDTSGIETVLIDCVKATVTNGKYQEAKELCELLLSVQALGESKDATNKTT